MMMMITTMKTMVDGDGCVGICVEVDVGEE